MVLLWVFVLYREFKISEMMQEQSWRDDAASVEITHIIHSFEHKNGRFIMFKKS